MTFPHTATIQEMTKVGTQYTFADSGTTPCFLQPLSSEMAQSYGIQSTKAHACFLPVDADVAEKKRLVIDGVTYGVKGVRTHNYGSIPHKRAILETFTA